MVDVSFPVPRQWQVQHVLRVLGVLAVLFAVVLLALNWSSVLVVAQSLSNDAHNCHTKLGKAADRVVSFVLQRGSQCESNQSDTLPLGIP